MDPAAGERQPLRAPQRSARPAGGRSRRAPAADVACPDVPAQMCRRCRRMAISSFPDNRSSGGWRRRHGIPPPPTPSGFFGVGREGEPSRPGRSHPCPSRRQRRSPRSSSAQSPVAAAPAPGPWRRGGAGAWRSNDEPQTLPSPPTQHVRPPRLPRRRWSAGRGRCAAPRGQPSGRLDGPGRRRPSSLPPRQGGATGFRLLPIGGRMQMTSARVAGRLLGGRRAGSGQRRAAQAGGEERGRAPRAARPPAAERHRGAGGRGAVPALRGCVSAGTVQSERSRLSSGSGLRACAVSLEQTCLRLSVRCPAARSNARLGNSALKSHPQRNSPIFWKTDMADGWF
ncbi:uncharacterized protein LOC110389706 [Numida meleagris]|uniref:uncharacterized protein LOC110389706 n=1 Tax=Numida meleagris TaxID=8996 RepID=UPI000B3DF41A|nr:uncharacterized protein LOC110389706 [Numida meleagris]